MYLGFEKIIQSLKKDSDHTLIRKRMLSLLAEVEDQKVKRHWLTELASAYLTISPVDSLEIAKALYKENPKNQKVFEIIQTSLAATGENTLLKQVNQLRDSKNTETQNQDKTVVLNQTQNQDKTVVLNQTQNQDKTVVLNQTQNQDKTVVLNQTQNQDKTVVLNQTQNQDKTVALNQTQNQDKTVVLNHSQEKITAKENEISDQIAASEKLEDYTPTETKKKVLITSPDSTMSAAEKDLLEKTQINTSEATNTQKMMISEYAMEVLEPTKHSTLDQNTTIDSNPISQPSEEIFKIISKMQAQSRPPLEIKELKTLSQLINPAAAQDQAEFFKKAYSFTPLYEGAILMEQAKVDFTQPQIFSLYVECLIAGCRYQRATQAIRSKLDLVEYKEISQTLMVKIAKQKGVNIENNSIKNIESALQYLENQTWFHMII